MQLSLVVLTIVSATIARAQVGAWGQCGGSGYSGSTSCISGYTCVRQDEWWSQCKPGSGGGGATTTKTASTKTTTASSGGSTSFTCPGNSGKGCGVYQVSGLGSNKQKVTSCGGNTLDLAIAMLETEDMSTNYAYGDNKSDDAANFGIFKQNWGMLRECCSYFKGQSQSSWNNGAILNSDRCKDISCAHQCTSYYGIDKWFAGHRNGATGLANPNTNDIKLYKTAVYWLKDRIDSSSSYTSDNTRFWVDVVAI